MYRGGGGGPGPTGFPTGWYWLAALAATLLLTLAWYRRPGRGVTRTTLRTYTVTGLALVAVTAALPLLGWGTPATQDTVARAWLEMLWQQGTFALGGIAVALTILARATRSRMLAVITAVYVAAVALAGWLQLQHAPIAYFPSPDPAVLLPAAVLLLAALGTLLPALQYRGHTATPPARTST